MTEEIDQVVMKWQLAVITGKTEEARKHYDEYMKLALEFAQKQ